MSATHPTAEALERSLTRVLVADLPDRGLLLADQMRQDTEIALLHLADCQCGRPGVVILRTPEGERSNGGPRCWSCADRIVREYRSKLGETWTVEDPHATTPPPVRVVRLRFEPSPWPAATDRQHGAILLKWAANAAAVGADAVEYATDPGELGRRPMPEYAGHLAKRAAHFARLALGASS